MLAILLSAPSALALPPLPVIEIHDLRHQLIRAPAEYIVTAADTTLAEAQTRHFAPLTNASINQGLSRNAVWLRFRLSNAKGTRPAGWVLHHETSYLDDLTIYYSENDQPFERVELTDRAPFPDRPLTYRTLAFAHETPAGAQTDVFVRMGHERFDSLSLNLHLSERTVFTDRSRNEYFAFGLYFGVMASLLLIALFAAALLRQMVYLYYAAFLLFSSLMWAALSGFTFQYLWPSSVFLHNEGFHILYLAMAITALQFSRHFLKADEHFPRFNRTVTVLQVIMAGGILLRLAGVYGPVVLLSYASLVVLALLSLMGGLAWRRGQRYARWYALAWGVYGLGLTISVLSAATPLFNWGMDPLIFTQVCALLEALLLLVALGERLMAWENDRRKALTLARQDELTGLNNRRVFPQALEHYQARFHETGEPVYLIMIDLDHFKALNDRHGHAAGDQVLREFGRQLRNQCRAGDTCLRYGGEEFAMLVQVRSEHEAFRIAERIRLAFEVNPTRYEGQFINHTLTAGLAPIYSTDRLVAWDDIIKEADRALYKAKQNGRNSVTVFDGEAMSESQPDDGQGLADSY